MGRGDVRRAETLSINARGLKRQCGRDDDGGRSRVASGISRVLID